MTIDAERWLAERGIAREPLIAGPEAGVPATTTVSAPAAAPVPGPTPAAPPAEAAIEAAVEVADDGADEASAARPDDVEAAVAFVRRSTSNAPQSEGRLRTKLADRGHDDDTVDAALLRARAERLVDDAALLAALIAERRARGHADRRLRRDLRDRGFTGPQVDEALTLHGSTDPAAAAFAVARDHAARNRGVEPEVAVRRTVGALVRRGHGEALARKAARDAVYADREQEAVAGR